VKNIDEIDGRDGWMERPNYGHRSCQRPERPESEKQNKVINEMGCKD